MEKLEKKQAVEYEVHVALQWFILYKQSQEYEVWASHQWFIL
jgi:hypothetical protein